MDPVSVGSPLLWVAFTALVLVLLAFDLGVLQRGEKELTMGQAVRNTLIWVGLAALFAGWVFWQFGRTKGLEFVSGYILEEALSVDNLFVFLVLFSYFSVPKELQHRVLFWGILGALVMRGIFIGIGAALLQKFHWIEYLFGVFLVYTGGKLLFAKGEEVEPEKNPALRWFRRVVPSIDEYRGTHFFVKENGKWLATPLFMVLLTVEATDLVFAVDSIPAVFSVTTDPFIVYTSNIFAILGLRSLFFVLQGMMDKFHYLNVGLGVVLGFVGVKMLVSGHYVIPVGWSLGVIASVLGASIVASMLRPASPPLPHPTDESEVGDGEYRRTTVPHEPGQGGDTGSASGGPG